MKIATKEYKQENDYLISVIDSDGYDIKTNTPEEKLKFCYETFMAEYGWRVKQAGMLVALTDWLSGLPSACNVEFKNHEIIKLGQAWGRLPANASDTKIDRYLEKWFRFMAMRLISLWNRNDIAQAA